MAPLKREKNDFLKKVIDGWEYKNLEAIAFPILKKLSFYKCDIEIEEIKNPITRDIGLSFFKTIITDKNGDTFFGYSAGQKSSRIISLIEAYERFSFINSLDFEKKKFIEIDDKPSHEAVSDPISVDFSSYTKFDFSSLSSSLDHKNKFGLYYNAQTLEPTYIRDSIIGLQSSTSGCAVHLSFHQALKHAVIELIERDTIMRYWIQKKAFDFQPLEVINFNFHKTEDILKKYRYSLKMYTLYSQWNTPVSVAIITSKDQSYPYAFFGCGSGINLKESIQKAFREVLVKWCLECSSIKYTGKSSALKEDQANIYFHYSNWIKIQEYFNQNDLREKPTLALTEFTNTSDFFNYLNGVTQFYFSPMILDEDDISPMSIKVRSPHVIPMFFGREHFQAPQTLKLDPDFMQNFQLHPF